MTIQPLPEHLVRRRDRAVAAGRAHPPLERPAADLQRAMTGSASTVLAAVHDELLGTVMVGHDGQRGLGRRLMQACEEWVRACGVPKLHVMVAADNSPVAASYERLGYADADADANVVVLGRRLDGAVL